MHGASPTEFQTSAVLCTTFIYGHPADRLGTEKGFQFAHLRKVRPPEYNFLYPFSIPLPTLTTYFPTADVIVDIVS